MLSASTPSLRLGFSDSDFIFILPRVPPLTRLQPGLPYAAPHARGSELRTSYIAIRTFKLLFSPCVLRNFFSLLRDVKNPSDDG